MPRPRKCRKVCCMPKNTEFVPAGNIGANGVIIMTVDEYETHRPGRLFSGRVRGVHEGGQDHRPADIQ